MAYGNEFLFAFSYDKWPIIEEALEFKMPRPVPGDLHGYELYNEGYFDELPIDKALHEYWKELENHIGDYVAGPLVSKANEALLIAQRNCFEDMGFVYKQGHEHGSLQYLVYETPDGVREFSPFHLEFFYDPNEMGENPTHALIGVAISGRYFPVFLDWRDPHGTIWNPKVGPNPSREITIAWNRIVEVVPCFQLSDWIIRETHY